jgi:probable F420-dependent oxidoreductase
MPKPFRFLADPGEITDARSVGEAARRAESIGYSLLVFPDHLIHPYAVAPLLSVIAAATTTLRVSAFVFNNDLRHPAVLAQDLATVDVLSGGRVEVAIGAGWNKPEYESIGLAFDPVGVRVARLTEAVAVLKGAFGDGPFDFHGEHYTISALDGQPKPVQRPHPPFFIGGGGQRVLTLAGREADTVGLAPRVLPGEGPRARTDPRSLTVAATAEKIAWARAAAGDRAAALEFNVYPSGSPVLVTDHARKDGQDALDALTKRSGIEITLDEFLASPHVYIGSLDGLVEKIQGLREQLGISSFMVGDVDTLAPVVERLAGT